MMKKIYITTSEPHAQSKVYVVSSSALADEIVEYTSSETKADEIVYITAFEERANKKVLVVNSDDYFDNYKQGSDSMRNYDPPETRTVQTWILMGVNLFDQEKYALALECFSKALILDPHNTAALKERDRTQSILKQIL